MLNKKITFVIKQLMMDYFHLPLDMAHLATAAAIRAMNAGIYTDVVFKTNDRIVNDIALALRESGVDTLTAGQFDSLQATATVNTQPLPSGVYTASLFANDVLVATHIVTIIK